MNPGSKFLNETGYNKNINPGDRLLVRNRLPGKEWVDNIDETISFLQMGNQT